LIQGQGQGHGAFELLTISETVHPDGDDRSPLAGLSGIFAMWFLSFFFFPRLISAVADWMSDIFPHVVWRV